MKLEMGLTLNFWWVSVSVITLQRNCNRGTQMFLAPKAAQVETFVRTDRTAMFLLSQFVAGARSAQLKFFFFAKNRTIFIEVGGGLWSQRYCVPSKQEWQTTHYVYDNQCAAKGGNTKIR